MNAIPAISLWQPWASLIALGLKPFEFRGWVPPHRFMNRPVAIHAAKKMEPKKVLLKLLDDYEGTAAIPVIGAALYDELPLGAILCTATIVGHRLADGLVEPLTGETLHGGGFAWRLDKIKAYPQPIPATGSQGFWWWTPPVGRPRVVEQLVMGSGFPPARE